MTPVGRLHQAIGHADLGTRGPIFRFGYRVQRRPDQLFIDTQYCGVLPGETFIKEEPWNARYVVLFNGAQIMLRNAEFLRDLRDRQPLALPLFAKNATDGGH